MVHLSPSHHRGLDALAALVIAETGVRHVGQLGEPEGGVQLPPHAVPVQLLLVLAHGGPEPRSQHDLEQGGIIRDEALCFDIQLVIQQDEVF